MNTEERKFNRKQPKSTMAQYTEILIPLIEELADNECMPVCIVGARVINSETGEGKIYVATLTDDDSFAVTVNEILSKYVEGTKNGETKIYKDGKEVPLS